MQTLQSMTRFYRVRTYEIFDAIAQYGSVLFSSFQFGVLVLFLVCGAQRKLQTPTNRGNIKYDLLHIEVAFLQLVSV